MLEKHLAFWGIDMRAATEVTGQSMVETNFRRAERISQSAPSMRWNLPWHSHVLRLLEGGGERAGGVPLGVILALRDIL